MRILYFRLHGHNITAVCCVFTLDGTERRGVETRQNGGNIQHRTHASFQLPEGMQHIYVSRTWPLEYNASENKTSGGSYVVAMGL
jgi:hypothetical protein